MNRNRNQEDHMPRFYCDTRPADPGARQLPYVVIDRKMAESFPDDHGVIGRFSFTSDAEAFRDLKREQVGEEAPTGPKVIKTIEAADLRPFDGVKAMGAHAFTTIRSIELDHPDWPGKIVVFVDWGKLVYNPDERVEVETPELAGTPA